MKEPKPGEMGQIPPWATHLICAFNRDGKVMMGTWHNGAAAMELTAIKFLSNPGIGHIEITYLLEGNRQERRPLANRLVI